MTDIPEQLPSLVAAPLIEATGKIASGHPPRHGGGRGDATPDPVGEPRDQGREKGKRRTGGEEDVEHRPLDTAGDPAPGEFHDDRPPRARCLGAREQAVGTGLNIGAADDRGLCPVEKVDNPHPGRLGQRLTTLVRLGLRAGDHPAFGAHHRDRRRPSGPGESVTDFVEASIEILER